MSKSFFLGHSGPVYHILKAGDVLLRYVQLHIRICMYMHMNVQASTHATSKM